MADYHGRTIYNLYEAVPAPANPDAAIEPPAAD